MSSKKQLLDPVGTMCKLISLNFMRLNTKIGIKNHTLILYQPDSYQWIYRLFNNDKKGNISELLPVMIRIIKWYLVNKDEEPDKFMEFIKKLAKYMCRGLEKLQETYSTSQSGNTILSIQYFINLINDGLKGEYDDTKLPKIYLKLENEQKNFLDYDKIKQLWDVKKITRICELYDSCFETLSGDDSDNIKIKIIEGYLKSIDSILDLTDTEFRVLVEQNKIG